MPTRRPRRPIASRVIATPRVSDAETARAIAEVDAALRVEQSGPQLPPKVAKGDVFYVDANGRITRLAAGSTGQVLTMGAAGLPEWS